jgi:hypothetical protein
MMGLLIYAHGLDMRDEGKKGICMAFCHSLEHLVDGYSIY